MRGSAILADEALAAPEVFTHCDRFQVLGIHAAVIAAEVVYAQPFRDRTDEQMIRCSVCPPEAAIQIEDAISFTGNTAGPLPTTGVEVCYDLLQKPIHWGNVIPASHFSFLLENTMQDRYRFTAAADPFA